MKTPLRKKGQAVWEYALIIAFISIVVIFSLSGMGTIISESLYGDIKGEVEQVDHYIKEPPAEPVSP